MLTTTMKRKIFLMLALLTAIVQGAWAQVSWEAVYTMTQTISADWTALTEGSTTGQTLGSAGTTKYYYVNSDLSFTNSNIGGQKIVPAVVLADTGNNSTTLTENNGKQVAAALSGRTLYTDGDWNTLCLPFDFSLKFSGVEARTLTSASISGTTLTLTFSDPVTELKAGTPYIIKFEKEDGYVDNDLYNIVSPIFERVTIASGLHPYDTDEHTSAKTVDGIEYPAVETEAQVRFLGTYDAETFSATDNSILFLGDENKLYYPQPSGDQLPTIGACHAYFKIGTDGSAGDLARITAFNLNFGDDGSTVAPSSIHGVEAGEGARAPQGWYTLDGRQIVGNASQRYNHVPARLPKGVYINNGRKVVIK